MHSIGDQVISGVVPLLWHLWHDFAVGDMVPGAQRNQDFNTDPEYSNRSQYQLPVHNVRAQFTHANHLRLLYTHKGLNGDVQIGRLSEVLVVVSPAPVPSVHDCHVGHVPGVWPLVRRASALPTIASRDHVFRLHQCDDWSDNHVPPAKKLAKDQRVA